jgi:hypothetical protein
MNGENIELYSIFYKYLLLLRESLMNYLNSVLPELNQNWWNTLVIPKLSEKALTDIRKANIGKLENLDMAALLMVLKYNWSSISNKYNPYGNEKYYFNKGKINGIKSDIVEKIIKLRDRVSHATEDKMVKKNIPLYLENLIIFAEVISADKKLQDEISNLLNDYNSLNVLEQNESELNMLVIEHSKKITGDDTIADGKIPPPLVLVSGSVQLIHFYRFLSTGRP